MSAHECKKCGQTWDSAHRVSVCPNCGLKEVGKPEDRRLVMALNMTIEAAKNALINVNNEMPVEHSAGALGANVATALRECGAYSERYKRDRRDETNDRSSD